MKPTKCPDCGKKVERHADGSLAMHAQADGQVCEGTNQIKLADKTTMKAGGISFPVTKVWYDPDGTLE